MAKKFIVGLGNPGKKYENTRHNVGFKALEFLRMAWKMKLDQVSHDSAWGRLKEGPQDIFLIQPQTFMNDSGKSLLNWKRREGLSPESLLVVYDDMDLDVGRVRYRAAGSGGSHKGMASIIESLGSQDFARVRIGVGRPADPALWADYVLRPIAQGENDAYVQAMGNAKQAIDLWLKDEPAQEIMTRVNRKNVCD